MSQGKPNKKPQPKPTNSPTQTTLEPSSSGNIGMSMNWILCAMLMLVTFIAFQSSFDNKFVNWDDQVYVEEQPLVLEKQTDKLIKTPVSLNYHPITMLSLSAQVPENNGALTATPFITTNVWLHIFNSVLVFWLVWMLADKRSSVAIIVASIFALHPMHVESVVWVSERKDVLYTFFFLSGCLTYIRYSDTQKKLWYVLTSLLFLASVLSKAMGVVFPLVLILIDYWRGRKWYDTKVLLEKAPLLAMSAFFGLMAVDVQKGGDFHGVLTLYGEKVKALNEFSVFTVWQRIQFASYGFVMYIYKFFFPTDLCTFYPYPDVESSKSAVYNLAPLALLGVTGAALFAAIKNYSKLFLFGVGFYFVTVALVLQFLSVGVVIMADRYSYLPYIGLAFIVAFGLETLVEKKSSSLRYAWWGAAAFFCLFLMFKTMAQVETWQDSESLWTQVLKYYPNEDQALANRGNNYGKTGRIDLALKDFEKAVSDGCTRSDIYEGLGNCYGTMSSDQKKTIQERLAYVPKAIEMYNKALELDGSRGNIWFNLGVAQGQTNPIESIKAFEKALELMPYKEGDIRAPLGFSYLSTGQFQKALENYNRAIALNKKSDWNFYYRGVARQNLGDVAGAKQDFAEAVRINPENQDAKLQLAK